MAALPPSPAAAAESTLEQRVWERSVHGRLLGARWMGWRLRGLVLGALLGCVALFLLLRLLVAQPVLQTELVHHGDGQLRLAGDDVPLIGLIGPQGATLALDAILLQRSARWLSEDAQRQRLLAQHRALAGAMAHGEVRLSRADASVASVALRARGGAGLSWPFWLFAAAALLLYLVTLVALFTRPDRPTTLYAVLALSQVGQLLLLGLAALPTPGAIDLGWDLALRSGLDLASAAALVHVTSILPRRVPQSGWRAAVAWAVAGGLLWGVTRGEWPAAWWWTQSAMLAAIVLALAQLLSMQRRRAHPLATQLLRFCITGLATLALLTVVVAVTDTRLASDSLAGSVAASLWVLFVSALLTLLPFLARTHQLMREFSLVAGVATVATSLDLLFVAVFSVGDFASLTLALFISLAAYAALRQWLMARLVARERLTTERMFEHLYRMAREIQVRPGRAGVPLARLLRELFDPLHVQAVAQATQHARVVGAGASLIVPLPALAQGRSGALVLGFAERGRRLFTADDARLADRIVDLIARAVAVDQAVERGRSEERVRIAQDLHDDIGARLLTLMYQAPTPEMEDYLRQTLLDLKTLTRGLAAPSHPLSHAVAEWKADITQRLALADIELGWSVAYQQDFELSVVQWSALTRILRELVSNAIAHGHARRIDIDIAIERGTLSLTVADDGVGGDPAGWAHGLGLGGVRKRAKQLAGSVEWRRRVPQGTVCHVVAPDFGPAPQGADSMLR